MRYFYSGQMRSTRLPKTQYTGWSSEQSHWMECASLCLPIVFHETKQKTKKLNRRLGTGEHGVGLGKKEYLVEKLGTGTHGDNQTCHRSVWIVQPWKGTYLLYFCCTVKLILGGRTSYTQTLVAWVLISMLTRYPVHASIPSKAGDSAVLVPGYSVSLN